MKDYKAISLLSKAQLIGQLNPAAWDALIPKSPFVFSNAHVDLLAADLVRQISTEIPDKDLSKKVFGLSAEMARSASSALASSWEPGDEICPRPFPFPFPHHFDDLFAQPEARFGPSPEPWKSIPSAQMVQQAYLLTQTAALTSDATFSKSLIKMASAVAATAAQTLVDDIERCGTKPRPKIGGHGPALPRPLVQESH
jgi:hypothetical protein